MTPEITALTEFLNGAHSVYHATAALSDILEKAGYQKLQEYDRWELVPGGKYYLTRNGTSLIAFRIPQEAPLGFMISASHSDRPTFKVKENFELSGAYTRMAVERYGGMLIAPWLDRPLSIAGRVTVETDAGVETKLLDIDRDLLLIPNLAIHMNRQVNENQKWNPAVDALPLIGGADAKGKLPALIEKEAGGRLLGHDLYLYVRQKASLWGMEEEFISAPALDDLEGVWCCVQGFLNAAESRAIPLFAAFDSEEVGSISRQGASADFLSSLIDRLCTLLELDRMQMLSRSMLISADNAHALHPNHPEMADPANAPTVNGGIVLKFNANQRYCTDGVSAALFRKFCRKAGAPVQSYCNRADIPGGSTLGNVSLSQVSVMTADIGLPQLAMHSCYETAGVHDVAALKDTMTVFFSSALDIQGDSYRIL